VARLDGGGTDAGTIAGGVREQGRRPGGGKDIHDEDELVRPRGAGKGIEVGEVNGGIGQGAGAGEMVGHGFAMLLYESRRWRVAPLLGCLVMLGWYGYGHSTWDGR
jgi:hypothetical protein